MRKITADRVYTIEGEPIDQGVVVVDKEGKILSVSDRSEHELLSLESHRGVIIPGFINTHCHLELSHMKGKVDTGTSLIPFISSVVKFRDISEAEILAAIDLAGYRSSRRYL